MPTSENVVEMQRSQAEEAERQVEHLQEELRKKESDYEQEILELRQRQTSKLRWRLLPVVCVCVCARQSAVS